MQWKEGKRIHAGRAAAPVKYGLVAQRSVLSLHFEEG